MQIRDENTQFHGISQKKRRKDDNDDNQGQNHNDYPPSHLP